MTFYDDMALVAKTMISNYKTGDVSLRRTTSAKPDPAQAYNPATVVTFDTYIMEAAVLGVTADNVDGELVTYDDLKVITSPFFWLNGVEIKIEPQMSDEIWIDGRNHRINKIERLPAAGIPSAFFIFVKA